MINSASNGARTFAFAVAMRLSILLLNLSAILFVPGCGGEDLDVDKVALYTPESLATEFAIGFKALSAETKATAGKVQARNVKNRPKPVFSENALKKGKRVGTPKKKETKGQPTLDELVDDVDAKIGLIRDSSRSETCRKMTETISNDRTLDDGERKTLTELVAKMAG